MKRKGIFISGTDTGVGKTLVSSLLLAMFRSQGISANYFKPVQTGDELDTPEVARWNELDLSSFPQPAYYFSEPVAPYLAALNEGKKISLERIKKVWQQLDSRSYWIVEGAGGLLVPLTSTQTMRDLVSETGLELLLVASTRLGTMNHTALSIEAARRAGIPFAGIILVGEPAPGLGPILEEMNQTRVLLEVPYFSDLSSKQIRDFAIQNSHRLKVFYEFSDPQSA